MALKKVLFSKEIFISGFLKTFHGFLGINFKVWMCSIIFYFLYKNLIFWGEIFFFQLELTEDLL